MPIEDTLSMEAAECVRQGLVASQAGDVAAALDLFSRAAVAAPASGIPWFLSGSEHAAAHDIDKAEACFANAVLLAPQLTLARYQLGLLQFSSGRAAIALLTWQPLLDLPEGDALPHFVRGFGALAADAFADARKHYEAGLACNTPDNPALAHDIRKILARMPASSDAQQPPPEDSSQAAEHVLISNYQTRRH